MPGLLYRTDNFSVCIYGRERGGGVNWAVSVCTIISHLVLFQPSGDKIGSIEIKGLPEGQENINPHYNVIYQSDPGLSSRKKRNAGGYQ